MFILLARADFRLLTESDAVPKLAPTIIRPEKFFG
jgi:hypothetical protein